MESKIIEFMELVKSRNNHEPEFLQAVQEVAETVIPYIVNHDIYHGKNILLRMVEPERLISFRISWVDDNGEIQVDVFANYTFSVSLNDSNSAGTVTPGNPLILNNLANGPYNVCLSISEFPNWQQCFTSTITNFEDLVADILNVDSAEQSALISLQGSKSYKVNVNDITYNYDFDDISLKTQKIPLESGTNKVTIQGHSDCQGIFSEEITIAAMKYYPNPATEEVSIDGLPINEVLQFKIFSSTGK